ncbi:MAG: hypothetical protein QW734_02165, partial [Candidatus Bathyarchaeia archaeon]
MTVNVWVLFGFLLGVMVCFVFFMPILDYEEFYRTFGMASLKFKLGYVKVLIWLPVYQFLIARFGSLIFLRLFSVFCVAISFFLVKKNCEAAGLSDVAVATALMY